MSAIVRLGCICTRIRFDVHEPTTVHHITDSGRRLGHMYTIPLNGWYHQGYCKPGMNSKQMEAYYGPSLAKSKKDFERVFGGEMHLLSLVRQELGWKEEDICPGS